MTERFNAFETDSVRLARRLLGQRLVHLRDGVRTAGVIVEVEAYLGEQDRAAHTYGGRRTRRNDSMYLAGGHAYVYFTYGMHYCMNVVAGRPDEGVAVLLRAIEPTEGLEAMYVRRRAARRERDLCSGPARLTQALAIDRTSDGLDLRQDRRLYIERLRDRPLPSGRIGTSPRVGVAYAGEWAARPLRFFVSGNPHVSRGRPSAPQNAV